ncbi:MAG: helix-hairpin-helix domain-containing protein [Acidobacteriota bacterium]|nr:helix-hairpin-helix domain-containing protein [Acidobacteriota bacterium]
MNSFKRFAPIFLALAWIVAGHASAAPAAKAKVDLNSASQQDLEALPGVGAATAKKIIAGRPYSSAADLSKAGVSAATINKISGMVTVSGAAPRSAASAAAPARESRTSPESSRAARPAAAPASAGSSAGAVDLNSASEKDLEALPGVGAATAKKIIAGRPYTSVGDLSKAGVSASTIQKISPLVTVSGARAGSGAASSSSASSPPASSPRGAAPAGAAASGPVDLNSASEKDLEALPGVGPVTAKKIVAGRPYSSVGDLGRAGVSAATISKISPMVTVRASSAASPSSRTASGASAAPAGRAVPNAPSASYQPPPSPGMVWVNLETKVFHREGDRWYGRTKRGQYMSEADAVKGGYRLSKEKDEPK